MGTRALIRVKQFNKTVNIYKHFDGYPSGLGFHLMRLLLEDSKIINDGNRIVKWILDELDTEVTFYNHIDIEYMYVIDCDKQDIKCYKVNNWGKSMVKKSVDLKTEYANHILGKDLTTV